jgi:transketolase N-terminal domain/subunit
MSGEEIYRDTDEGKKFNAMMNAAREALDELLTFTYNNRSQHDYKFHELKKVFQGLTVWMADFEEDISDSD